MGEYQGQPEYVIAGFRLAVFDEWLRAVDAGDEWQDMMQALLLAGERMLGISNDDRLLILTGWIEEELVAAHDADFYADVDEPIGPDQARLDRTAEYWSERSVSFKASDAFAAEVERMPDWLLNTGIVTPKMQDDPEWAEFERLRAKFSKLR